MIEPSEYRSEATDGAPPVKSSGAAWSWVSRGSPDRVTNEPAGETSKSPSSGSPMALMNTFCGFRFWCSTPARWALSSAPATFTPMSTASRQSSAPEWRSRSCSLPRLNHSVTMYGLRLATPESNTVNVLGCTEMTPIAAHSRSKRAWASRSRAFTVNTFTATSRLKFSCTPR